MKILSAVRSLPKRTNAITDVKTQNLGTNMMKDMTIPLRYDVAVITFISCLLGDKKHNITLEPR